MEENFTSYLSTPNVEDRSITQCSTQHSFLSFQTNMKRVSDDIMTLEYYWLIVYVYIRGRSKSRWDNTNRNPISSS